MTHATSGGRGGSVYFYRRNRIISILWQGDTIMLTKLYKISQMKSLNVHDIRKITFCNTDNIAQSLQCKFGFESVFSFISI